jgi:hypothetical protein
MGPDPLGHIGQVQQGTAGAGQARQIKHIERRDGHHMGTISGYPQTANHQGLVRINWQAGV